MRIDASVAHPIVVVAIAHARAFLRVRLLPARHVAFLRFTVRRRARRTRRVRRASRSRPAACAKCSRSSHIPAAGGAFLDGETSRAMFSLRKIVGNHTREEERWSRASHTARSAPGARAVARESYSGPLFGSGLELAFSRQSRSISTSANGEEWCSRQ